MYTLSDKQIDHILSDISARGVEMESLQQNLLDHICCIIEQELKEDEDFESFYSETIKKFYKHELWEIEEETIALLTFKNYYTMKKTMLISGVFSAFTITFGIIFKFMHWPGAAALLIMGIFTSSLLFLPLLFILKVKEKQQTRDRLVIGLGSLAGIAISMGILFKLMHWPYANMLVFGAVMLMLFVFLPVFYFTGIRNPETKVNTMVTSVLLIIGCGLFMALIRTPRATLIAKTSDTQEFLRTEKMIATEKSILSSLQKTDSLAPHLNGGGQELVAQCELLKMFLIEQESGRADAMASIQNRELTLEDHSFSEHPFGPDSVNIKKYQNMVESLNNYNTSLASQKLALTSIDTESTFVQFIAEFSYNQVTLKGILNQLSQIQMQVLQNEEAILIHK